MSKPLNEFGGWLFFFYIINILGILFCLYSFIISFYNFYNLFQNHNSHFIYYYTFVFVELIITFIVYLFIFKNIKIRDINMPKRIFLILKLLIIITLLFSVAELLSIMALNDDIFIDLMGYIIKDTIHVIIICLIWMTYFKRSIRVTYYYGENASR